jgi:hypothetical protein
MNTKKHILSGLLAVTVAIAAFSLSGCNYQKDVTSYERSTPFVSEDGTVLVETLSFETSLNQERDFAEITLAVDSEYEFSPENMQLSFTQPDESRGGGFYMHGVGYRTAVNVEAINALTDRDTSFLEDARGTITDSIDAATNPIP